MLNRCFVHLRLYINVTRSIIIFLLVLNITTNPANTYLLKVNNRNTRKRCELCSMLTIKTPEYRH